MKKFLEQSSWCRWSMSLSKGAAIGSMLIMAFAVVGCDDSSSASAGPNEEPGVESSSSSSGKVTEPDEVTSSSSEKAKSSSSVIASETKQSNSSSSVDPISSSSLQGDKKSSSSGVKDTSSSSLKSESSSSVGDSQSSSSKDPELAEGFLTDNRDGQTYKTVTIGTQTWMAENLNYADSVTTASLKGKSWCYNDVAANCDVAGRLYTWAAAIDSVKLATDADNPLDCGYGRECGLTGKVQGICPSGWHLPSYDEWNALFTAVGGQLNAGKVLKSQTGWYSNGNGTDAFGFSALPAGSRYDYGYFNYDGYHAYFWSATELYTDLAYLMYLYYFNEYAYLDYDFKDFGFSVRCLRD